MPGFTNAERLVLYTHLRTFESDFDKSQSQMRAICSAWSGVVVGAAALIVTSAYSPPSGMSYADAFARATTLADLRTLVCIVGSAGVYAFWFIDQQVYQRLLHSVFAYGLYLEFKNPDLPQIRSTMFIANIDVTNGLAWFYRTQFFLFLIISSVFVTADGLANITLPEVSLLAFHLLGCILGQTYFETRSSLKELVSTLYANQGLAGAMPGSQDDQRAALWQSRIAAHPVPYLTTAAADQIQPAAASLGNIGGGA